MKHNEAKLVRHINLDRLYLILNTLNKDVKVEVSEEVFIEKSLRGDKEIIIVTIGSVKYFVTTYGNAEQIIRELKAME